MSGKTALVTGADGSLGTHVTNALQDTGSRSSVVARWENELDRVTANSGLNSEPQ